MTHFANLTGKRFGSLVALHRIESAKRTTWLVVCDCGTQKEIRVDAMTRWTTVSCGCVGERQLAEYRNKHGMHLTSTYSSWHSMRSRCESQKCKSYPRYGGDGIKVCDRWKDFAAFLEDMGPAPEGYSIDRIKGHLGYEPGNCRWATAAQQARNKRTNINLSWRGETMCLTDWAARLDVNVHTLYARVVRSGWPLDRAFTRPVSQFGDRQPRVPS